MASAKPSSPAMEFLVESLKKDKTAAYADLKAKADAKKLTIFPVMYGRAKATLGLVKVAKYGTGKFAQANAAKAGGNRGRAADGSLSSGRVREPLKTGSSAAETGKKRGRPVDGSSKSGQVRELLRTGMSAAEIAKKVGCTVGLVYNVKSASGGATKRGPGRPRSRPATATATTRLDGLAGILEAVKNSERERTQMRTALQRIQAVLADVLG